MEEKWIADNFSLILPSHEPFRNKNPPAGFLIKPFLGTLRQVKMR
jgi:hypothetical protein